MIIFMQKSTIIILSAYAYLYDIKISIIGRKWGNAKSITQHDKQILEHNRLKPTQVKKKMILIPITIWEPTTFFEVVRIT